MGDGGHRDSEQSHQWWQGDLPPAWATRITQTIAGCHPGASRPGPIWPDVVTPGMLPTPPSPPRLCPHSPAKGVCGGIVCVLGTSSRPVGSSQLTQIPSKVARAPHPLPWGRASPTKNRVSGEGGSEGADKQDSDTQATKHGSQAKVPVPPWGRASPWAQAWAR